MLIILRYIKCLYSIRSKNGIIYSQVSNTGVSIKLLSLFTTLSHWVRVWMMCLLANIIDIIEVYYLNACGGVSLSTPDLFAIQISYIYQTIILM